MTFGKATTDVVAYDVELAGDVLRVAVSGLPALTSLIAAEALSELRSRHEPFRDFLNLPPHGNHRINSCLLYPPFQKGADGALFLASRFAYAPFAGTALMAAATVLADTRPEPFGNGPNRLWLQTARGVMPVELDLSDGIVARATWITGAPRRLARDAELRLTSGQTVPVALVDAGLPDLVVEADR